MLTATLIVSTYNQPELLDKCLLSLARQSEREFQCIVADDGSGDETRAVARKYQGMVGSALRRVWHEDRGFRKTTILNKAILASASDYLVFIDGDCIAHPDLVREHLRAAEPGAYLNGGLIRLSSKLSDRIGEQAILSGDAFRTRWLLHQGGYYARRYLRLDLGHRLRSRLNQWTPTRLYWLGSNSSCYREDAIAVNGFDNRFSYGFEDGDFGNRLELNGVRPKTVRWTAIALHLWHPRPWSSSETLEANRKLMDENMAMRRLRAIDGLDELSD